MRLRRRGTYPKKRQINTLYGVTQQYRLGIFNPLGKLDKTCQLAQVVHHDRLIQNGQRFVSDDMACDVEIGERSVGVDACEVFCDDG
jgi:hypothetical protein